MKQNTVAQNAARPMMITSPDGDLFPVQSIMACATRLGQILRQLTGEDKKFLDYKGIQNRLEAGDNVFGAGPLKGWRFDYCENDEAQVRAFLTRKLPLIGHGQS